MGCSPSQSVIIQSSSNSHETICLQPTIYMVSETTVKLLQDVGELKVFHVDDSDHAKIIEKYGFAEDQLANPLHYQPQVRSSRSITFEDIERGLPSSSRSTIQSQQSLTAEPDDKLEEKRRMTVGGNTSNECDMDDALLSETRLQEVPTKHLDTAESENSLSSATKVERCSGQEEIESNLSRNESTAHFSLELVNRNVIGAGTSQFVELCGKGSLGSLTPVECEEMVQHNRLATTELAARYSANIYHAAINKNEQVTSDLPDGGDSSGQEKRNRNVVAKETDNKHEEAADLTVAQGTETENKATSGIERKKLGGSMKGMFIKVKSLDLDDE